MQHRRRLDFPLRDLDEDLCILVNTCISLERCCNLARQALADERQRAAAGERHRSDAEALSDCVGRYSHRDSVREHLQLAKFVLVNAQVSKHC